MADGNVPFHFFFFGFVFRFSSPRALGKLQKASKLNNWIRIIIYLLYSEQQAINWGSESNKKTVARDTSYWKNGKASSRTVLLWNTQSTRNMKHMNNGKFQYIFGGIFFFIFSSFTCLHGYHTDNLKHIFHTSSTPWTTKHSANFQFNNNNNNDINIVYGERWRKCICWWLVVMAVPFCQFLCMKNNIMKNIRKKEPYRDGGELNKRKLFAGLIGGNNNNDNK